MTNWVQKDDLDPQDFITAGPAAAGSIKINPASPTLAGLGGGGGGVASVEGQTGAVDLKTVGGQSLIGPGDIPLPAAGVTSVEGQTGAVDLKTVGGVSLIGPGDIPLPSAGVTSIDGATGAVDLATVGGQSLVAGGNIPFPVTSVEGATGAIDLKTVGGISLIGPGDIPLGGGGGAVTSVDGATGAVDLVTVGGQQLVGSGDIPFPVTSVEGQTGAVDLKTVGGISLVGPGDIAFPADAVTSVGGQVGAVDLKTVGGSAITGTGDIPFPVTSVEGATGAVDLKTVGGISLVGAGDIPFPADAVTSVGGQVGAVALKTVGGNVLTGTGDIPFPVTSVEGATGAIDLKTVGGVSLLGPGDISLGSFSIPYFKNLEDYFTAAEWTAIQANDYTTLTSAYVTQQLQLAIQEAEGIRSLVWRNPAYFKLNAPLRFYGRLNMGPTADTMYAFGAFYPDLSIDWATAFPNRGLFESANYNYPTLPPGKPSWPNSKPDFIAATHLWGMTLQADMDPLWSANRNRVPRYGWVFHCANEAFVAERCYANRFGAKGFLLSGLQSTPTLRNCGGFHNGFANDTPLGLAVTRPAAPFGAAVTIWAGVDAVPGPDFYVEAATNADLATIAAGNSLTINGTAYTVASVGTVTLLNERTVTGGTVTTQRNVLRVSLTANLPAYTFGRNRGAAVGVAPHPDGAAFAPSVPAAEGGQGDGGMVIIENASGDFNNTALLTCESRCTFLAIGSKSEKNPSMFVAVGNGVNGGNNKAFIFNGYRAEKDGSVPDQSVFRVIGHLFRPMIQSWGSQDGTGAFAMVLQNLTDSTMPSITNHGNGRGPFFWTGTGDRIVHLHGVELWDKRVKAEQFIPFTVPVVTGSRGGNAALTSLLAALATLGLINNSTTA